MSLSSASFPVLHVLGIRLGANPAPAPVVVTGSGPMIDCLAADSTLAVLAVVSCNPSLALHAPALPVRVTSRRSMLRKIHN